MSHIIPKVAAVQDISCYGRCSLSVIIPVLSIMGIQVCPLPTAVLSTHLGGFNNLEFYDFTDRMPAFFQHWQREQITFDALYSGFLASEKQIDTVRQFIDEFKRYASLVLVDPVMGDGGKLYSTYTPVMQHKMKDLVSRADVITPNYTEACFLLGKPYQDSEYHPEIIRQWLLRLSAMGPSRVVITGIPHTGGRIVNAGYDRGENAYWEVSGNYIPVRYPGTGDIFASVLLGALLNGASLADSMHRAEQFVTSAIEITYRAGTPVREGVLLEKIVGRLGS
ncbi:hypothetical protein P22_0978 [Propionispora sp. 2/2-37]|uniref:pyridoxamine kinase n=1 Tax=Propionispora sp. 2/2-37 TaxID=1677858 RepID=UPI0006BB7AFC|nr:pyridoxamine kinase [Propionispora sp. 2/2-37]CUH94909.1 hypothetical protein P22_0978 [Propionispora sp. 2/2-37]